MTIAIYPDSLTGDLIRFAGESRQMELLCDNCRDAGTYPIDIPVSGRMGDIILPSGWRWQRDQEAGWLGQVRLYCSSACEGIARG